MKKLKVDRHGDLVFVPVKSIPKGLKKSTKTVLLQSGSSGNPHSFQGGTYYPHVDGMYIIGYLVAKNTKLYHPEHGYKKVENLKEAKLPDGKYQIRRQVEKTHEGLRPVID